MKRIISAAIMLIIFIPLLITGGKPFAILMSLLAVLGLYELLHMRETRNFSHLIILHL